MPLPKSFPRPKTDSETRILANRYVIERKLGSGNFGVAWLVKDLKCKDAKDQMKVLKEISVGELAPDETVDAMHEASLLRNLDHPGIVKFVDSFIDGGYFCIVTEFCEGGDLDVRINDAVKNKKPVHEALIVEWLIQLLLAVQYMHSRKVLHRDLKARNIFLRNNMIKVGDLGISRFLMGTSDMASTFVGTPYYMSPEVLKHEGYNSKSDIWSVGCILYELVSLKHAFEGQSLMGVMYKIVEGSLPEWPKNYSQELQEVFARMLEKDPSKRPSALEVLNMPFIAKQMQLLKNTMIELHHAKEQNESINRESQQIEMALKQRSSVQQLRKESEEAKWKNMSPRERMRLRKQMKADEEARKLQEVGLQQKAENARIYEVIKKGQSAFESQLDWRKQSSLEEEEQHQGNRPITAPGVQRKMFDSYNFEHDDHEYVRTVPARIPEDYWSDDDEAENKPFPFLVAATTDHRPITPMKNKMVYNVAYSTLDFKDGIPDKPELAETYYSQFEDEFEQDADADQDDDEEEEEDENEGTLLATVVEGKKENDNEVGDLISCMQNALDHSDTISGQTVTEDTIVGAFGPVARATKIKNLRSECEKKLGERQFEAAYDYLKKARFGSDQAAITVDESKIMDNLRKLVKNPMDCFLVDQLLFLEEQAKVSES